MKIAYVDQNDCNFTVRFDNPEDADKVRQAIIIGIDTWYVAAHDNEDIQDYLMDEGNEYFTADDIEGAYYLGYADLTTDLLLRCGIDHEILDVEYDEDDHVICDDIVRGW